MLDICHIGHVWWVFPSIHCTHYSTHHLLPLKYGSFFNNWNRSHCNHVTSLFALIFFSCFLWCRDVWAESWWSSVDGCDPSGRTSPTPTRQIQKNGRSSKRDPQETSSDNDNVCICHDIHDSIQSYRPCCYSVWLIPSNKRSSYAYVTFVTLFTSGHW